MLDLVMEVLSLLRRMVMAHHRHHRGIRLMVGIMEGSRGAITLKVDMGASGIMMGRDMERMMEVDIRVGDIGLEDLI